MADGKPHGRAKGSGFSGGARPRPASVPPEMAPVTAEAAEQGQELLTGAAAKLEILPTGDGIEMACPTGGTRDAVANLSLSTKRAQAV